MENPPDPPISLQGDQFNCAVGASNWHTPSSLLSNADGNYPPDNALGDRAAPVSEDSGGNALEDRDLPAGVELIQSMLFDVQAWLETSKEATREASEQALRIRAEAQQQTHVSRMQQFLDSGDPILMAEAIAWVQINPGVLDEEALAMIALRDSAQVFMLCLQELLPRMQGLLLAFFSDHWRSTGSEGLKMNE